MVRRSVRRPAVLLAAAALAASMLSTPTGAAAGGYEDATLSLPRETSGTAGLGPFRPYVQQIMIGGVVPLKDQAIVNRTKHGYLFRAGQQDTDLLMTIRFGKLRFIDRGTQSWKWLPRGCRRLNRSVGVAAACHIPKRMTNRRPMLVEVWPRLGDDVVDASRLPRRIDVSILGDMGDDVAYLGPGNDFFNGAQDNDRVYGGDGNDWLRTGIGDDYIDGGNGDDNLVGVDDNDEVHGGNGDDRLVGGNGNDRLFAGPGRNFAICGNGVDDATVDQDDRTLACERLFGF